MMSFSKVLLKKNKDIPIEDLLNLCYLTGSRAFGTERPDSDWDLVYSVHNDSKINSLTTGLVRAPSNYNSGFWIDLKFGKVNFIPVHPQEFPAWVFATRAVKAILKDTAILDRSAKIALFESLVTMMKLTLPSKDFSPKQIEDYNTQLIKERK